MLRHVVAFELRYWLRSYLLWSFLLMIAVLIFGAVSTDRIVVGEALTNTHRNAPHVILNFYAMIGLFTLLMATAFVNSAAARDFSYNTYQILFSTPLRRFDFVTGRFLGAALVATVPVLGVSLGILLAKPMPWIEPERWGPVSWEAHFVGAAVFGLPNSLFAAAVLFAVAVLARNEVASFAAAIGMLVAYIVAEVLVQGNLEREQLAALLDPFGVRTFALVTKYWTVAEKNSRVVELSGLLLWNRLLWLGVAAAVFAFAYARFSFAERRTKARRLEGEPGDAPVAATPLAPPARLRSARFAQYLSATRLDLKGVVKGPVFLVVLALGLVNAVASLLTASDGYGNTTFPVTYQVVETIAGTLYLFVIGLITFYAGVLVWRERDARLDEIVDALPTPEWLAYAARLTALVLMVLGVQALALLAGVGVQLLQGYHRHQFDLFLGQLFLRDASLLVFLAVLALFMQVMARNKHLGHLLFVAFLLANVLGWRALNVVTNLLRFGARPPVRHSDFFGDLPYRAAWGWFTLYWLLVCALVALASVAFWPRGRSGGRARWREAGRRLRGGLAMAAVVGALLLAATAGWIAYNTKVLNPLLGPKDLERLQADYEKAYKPLASVAQPRLRSVDYGIDIFPETRNVELRADSVLENASGAPLRELHLSLARGFDTTVEVPGARLAKDDTRLDYRIYRFEPELQPGERRRVRFVVKSRTRGFENTLSQPELMPNGTFFNNTIAPRIGYDPQRELSDPNDRRRHGLGEQQLMPALERDCGPACNENYLGGHADWVDMHTVISTSPDQIAVAPGSLQREWREGGRRYFEYRLDRASLGFCSFISARYAVARGEWNGVKLEVYHLPEHAWNVPRMLNSMRRSLDYFGRNFGPYAHKQARILEFPRVARFAQAFPGTMPYSESIGFIANLEHPDDIDMVFYVVAHEMAHQWWAHQVIGARMQGATLLSESLSQYSALMVMEQEYGRDLMRKFLRYEMDNYLRSRGRERLKERPLLTVEEQQGYVHYRKASVVLYSLKETIGAAAVNRALRKLVERHGYAPAPYPTSYALVDALREETPPELQPLLKDLFEDITLFSNRALAASARRRPDGRFDVTLEVEARKFKADAQGNESEVALDDWIEVGAFAKPGAGRKYGRTLHRERVRLQGTRSTHTFVCDERPDRAGIDPFLLLVDRVPEDNVRPVGGAGAAGEGS